jgi:hypothetical protein
LVGVIPTSVSYWPAGQMSHAWGLQRHLSNERMAMVGTMKENVLPYKKQTKLNFALQARLL